MKGFTTSRGIEVTFHGIATMLDSLRAAYPEPEAPTYEVELPGTLDPQTEKPRTETHYHDDTTVATPEEKEAMRLYHEAVQENTAQYEAAIERLTYLRGIKFPRPTNEDWIALQHEISPKIMVPDDPAERLVYYVKTEVIGSLDDAQKIMTGVMEASGVSEKAVTAMQDAFRRPMEEPNGNGAHGSPNPLGTDGLVHLSTVRAGQDSPPETANSGKPV